MTQGLDAGQTTMQVGQDGMEFTATKTNESSDLFMMMDARLIESAAKALTDAIVEDGSKVRHEINSSQHETIETIPDGVSDPIYRTFKEVTSVFEQWMNSNDVSADQARAMQIKILEMTRAQLNSYAKAVVNNIDDDNIKENLGIRRHNIPAYNQMITTLSVKFQATMMQKFIVDLETELELKWKEKFMPYAPTELEPPAEDQASRLSALTRPEIITDELFKFFNDIVAKTNAWIALDVDPSETYKSFKAEALRIYGELRDTALAHLREIGSDEMTLRSEEWRIKYNVYSSALQALQYVYRDLVKFGVSDIPTNRELITRTPIDLADELGIIVDLHFGFMEPRTEIPSLETRLSIFIKGKTSNALSGLSSDELRLLAGKSSDAQKALLTKIGNSLGIYELVWYLEGIMSGSVVSDVNYTYELREGDWINFVDDTVGAAEKVFSDLNRMIKFSLDGADTEFALGSKKIKKLANELQATLKTRSLRLLKAKLDAAVLNNFFATEL